MLGAWLCGAAVSVGDPALPPNTVRAQVSPPATAKQTEEHVDKMSIHMSHCDCCITAVTTYDGDPQVAVCKPKLVVTTAAAAPHYTDLGIPVLVLDREPWQSLPAGTESFRSLYNSDVSRRPGSPASLSESVAVVHWTSGTSGNPKGVQHSQRYIHNMLKPSKVGTDMSPNDPGLDVATGRDDLPVHQHHVPRGCLPPST